MSEHTRIKFYSVHDLSFASNMKRVESFFEKWEQNTCSPDINTILELYNIKQYFSTGRVLSTWSNEQLDEYQKKVSLIPGIIGRFCNSVLDEEWNCMFKSTEINYVDDFWTVIDNYKVYSKISANTIGSILDSNSDCVWYILRHRALSAYYGTVLTNHLLTNCNTAPRMISFFLETSSEQDDHLYFPEEFTPEMRIKIINDYVDEENPNINTLQLLENARVFDGQPIEDKLRRKVRNKRKELQEKLSDKAVGISYGIQVEFNSVPNGAYEEKFNRADNTIHCTYSRDWIAENRDYPTLLNNFIYLFKYVDRFFRCTFVSLKCRLSLTEKHLFTRGKDDYITGSSFDLKRALASLQMAAYYQELKLLNIRLEDIFSWFFEVYLRDEFQAIGFSYRPPSDGTTYYEKCKLISSAIDGVLKQYSLFREDGYVDRELLEMSSRQTVFGDIGSTVSNKYAYANSPDIRTEMFLLFDDQSILHFTEKTGNSNYSSLPQLLVSEKMSLSDFAEYQLSGLNWLIERGSIFADENGYLQPKKSRVFVLNDLFLNEVICPIYYDDELRHQVSNLAASGDLRYESTLFSIPEQKYLNFILNNAEFGNSLGIRNRYIHDTCPLDENTEFSHYCELLKIMVLIIIKINAEFCAPN